MANSSRSKERGMKPTSPILVSACLLGINCRYDGSHLPISKRIKGLLKSGSVIFICPEQLGGLPTPRPKNYLVGKRVINEMGADVTKNFLKGAKEVVRIAKLFGVKVAYLKSNSPSCGKDGMTKHKLEKAGIKIILIR